MSVYVDADDEEEKGQTMGAMEKGSALSLEKLEPSQHFTHRRLTIQRLPL